MKGKRNNIKWLGITVAALLSVLSLLIWSYVTSAQTGMRGVSQSSDPVSHLDDCNLLSQEERARELELIHELNLRRVASTYPSGAARMGAEVTVEDTDDISVIRNDGTLAIPRNLFDLSGRAVLYTPSGSGYSVTGFDAPFDTDLGSKLDLTLPPAYSSTGGINKQPGDDAYLLQDLGFSFTFYGESYTKVAVCSNGGVTFRPTGMTEAEFNAHNVRAALFLSIFQRSLPRIAPYWRDLSASADATQGENGIYFRRDSDRVVVSWNNISQFPNRPDTPRCRFQVTLFADGRILTVYQTAQLPSNLLTNVPVVAGISPGNSSAVPALIDLSNPPTGSISAAVAELFITTAIVDLIAVVNKFYTTHPNQDVYDFVYFLTDFEHILTATIARSFYQPLNNDVTGTGQETFNSTLKRSIGSQRIQGLLYLNDILTRYPPAPSMRLSDGIFNAVSLWANEQGHRWLAYPLYPGANPDLLVNRRSISSTSLPFFVGWNFFLNTESTLSSPAARRSSTMYGNVWRENPDSTFTTVGLVDGYSRLDQYLMGLRPSEEVPDTFIVNPPADYTFRRSTSLPEAGITAPGTKQAITINDVIQANGPRVPNAASSPKNFRAAMILFLERDTPPAPSTLDKLNLFRLAFESYFAQSTDYLAKINTGLAESSGSRVIAAVSAADQGHTLAPGGIATLYGVELADDTEIARSLPLPDMLAGTRVLVNGVPAPLYYASASQINFQVPRSTSATTSDGTRQISSAAITVEVVRNNKRIRAGVFQIAPSVPAMFTSNGRGKGPAFALDAITFTGPPYAATRANGDPNILAFFGTAFGADATDVEGNVFESVEATIDGNPVTVLYAGRAPGLIGVNQLNLVLPSGITSGTHTVAISRNGIPANPVTIEIR